MDIDIKIATQNKDRVNMVKVYEDDDNAIIITRDHYKGVCIQLVRYAHGLDLDGSKIKHAHSIEQVVISTFKTGSHKSEMIPDFKDQIIKAVSTLKKSLGSIKKSDDSISGVLNDLRSQNKVINIDITSKGIDKG